MICLSDNDIIYKLAACDLLIDAWTALGLTVGNVCVLPTAKHKFGLTTKPDKAEKRYGTDIVVRIGKFLSNAREIDFGVPATDLQLLANVDGIDAGEAVLYAAAAQSEACRLATGDKRSLRALAEDVNCRGIAGRLSGRIICLEQIVHKSIGHYGFEYV